MDHEDELQSVESLVRLLAEDHLTSSEAYFLIRRLSFKTDAEAWVMLHSYYGHPPGVLREIEKRVLLRVSPSGLSLVEGILETVRPDAPDSELSPSEYVNLRALVERAVELQLKNKLLRQERPDPAILLAEDEKPRRPSRQSHAPVRNGVQPSPSAPPAPLRPQSQPTVRQQKVRSSATPHATNGESPQHDSSTTITDVRLPASLDGQPERLLESLWLLYQWLNEDARTVRQLSDHLNRHWRLRPDASEAAFEFLYAVGLIARADPGDWGVKIVLVPSADLTVSAFRRACANAFARLVSGNDRLLAVLDHLTYAPRDQIARVAFGSAAPPDLPARLTVWEALGIAERERKGAWSITSAGRTLMESLPPIPVYVEDDSVPISVRVGNDWLNML